MAAPQSSTQVPQSDEDEPFLFDSVAVHFNFNVFFRQLFIHLFWPIGCFLSPNATAQSFKSLQWGNLFYQHFMPVCVILMAVAYFEMKQTVDQEEFSHFQGSLWYPLLFAFLHKVTVAIKYASLSQTEYKKFMSCSTEEEVQHYNNQLQLTNAYMKTRNQEVLEFLIIASALKCGAHIDTLDFAIDDPNVGQLAATQFQSWSLFLRDNEDDTTTAAKYLKQGNNNKYFLGIFDFCKKIINHTDKQVSYKGLFKYISRFFALLVTSIPFFGFVAYVGHIQSWTTVYLVSAAMVTFTFFQSIFLFISIALIDVLRKDAYQWALLDLIRLTDINHELSVTFTMGEETQNILKHGEVAVNTLKNIRLSCNRRMEEAFLNVREQLRLDALSNLGGDRSHSNSPSVSASPSRRASADLYGNDSAHGGSRRQSSASNTGGVHSRRRSTHTSKGGGGGSRRGSDHSQGGGTTGGRIVYRNRRGSKVSMYTQDAYDVPVTAPDSDDDSDDDSDEDGAVPAYLPFLSRRTRNSSAGNLATQVAASKAAAVYAEELEKQLRAEITEGQHDDGNQEEAVASHHHHHNHHQKQKHEHRIRDETRGSVSKRPFESVDSKIIEDEKGGTLNSALNDAYANTATPLPAPPPLVLLQQQHNGESFEGGYNVAEDPTALTNRTRSNTAADTSTGRAGGGESVPDKKVIFSTSLERKKSGSITGQLEMSDVYPTHGRDSSADIHAMSSLSPLSVNKPSLSPSNSMNPSALSPTSSRRFSSLAKQPSVSSSSSSSGRARNMSVAGAFEMQLPLSTLQCSGGLDTFEEMTENIDALNDDDDDNDIVHDLEDGGDVRNRSSSSIRRRRVGSMESEVSFDVEETSTPERDDDRLNDPEEAIDIAALFNLPEDVSNLPKPRLTFRYEENLVSWCWARFVILFFGDRFTARLDLFTWCCAISNLILMGVALTLIFGAETVEKQHAAFFTPIFRQAITSVSIFSIFLIVYTFLGANVNWTNNQQRALLSSHLLRVRERILDHTYMEYKSKSRRAKDIAHWQGCERAILSCLETLKANNDFKPFYVVGFQARYIICQTMASGAISFVITIMSMYYATLPPADEATTNA